MAGAIGKHGAVAKSATAKAKADRFTKDTAKRTGRSERVVQLDAERGEKIAADVLERIKDTHLGTASCLDEPPELVRGGLVGEWVRLTEEETARQMATQPAPPWWPPAACRDVGSVDSLARCLLGMRLCPMCE